MKVAHFEIMGDDIVLFDQLRKNFPEQSNLAVEFIEEDLTLKTVRRAADAEIVTVFIDSIVDQKVIDSLPKTKLIITRSVGFDHIDVTYAQSRGITVCNVPAYGSRTVAEFAFALLFSLSRKVHQASEQIRHEGSWDVSHFQGINLQGKTIGVVGTGKIGMNAVQIAKGLGMNVLATDAYPNEQKAQELGFRYVPFAELLGHSDVITLHVPANKDTFHLINANNIRHIKRGAILINTARGDVVETEALLTAIQGGILSAAGLDVLEGEHELKDELEFLSKNTPNREKLKLLLEDHMLMQYPNVLVTPHIAFNSKEARLEIVETTLENIRAHLNGAAKNAVEPKK